MNVAIFTSPTCGYCHQAKAYLSERGLRFIEYDVSRDNKAAQEMLRISGQMGVPVILVDGEVIVGFNRPRLEQLLSDSRRRITFGLSIANAGRLNLKSGAKNVIGAYVGKVASASLGERAGLKVGDIIIRLNKKEVNSAGDLEDIISDLDEGDRVIMDILRGDETIRSEIII